jgi:LPS export ABC transporter protein LptC
MSNFKSRNLLLVLALVVALALVMTIVVNRRPESTVQSVVKALPSGVDVALQDIDYTHVESGSARWRMVARQVERQAASGIMVVNNPQLSFFNDQGEVVGSMQAEEGSVTGDYQQIRLLNDVVLQNTDGYTIYTDLLNYDHEKKLATTDEAVLLESRGLSLEGTGMVFNVEQRTLVLNAKVKGLFNPGML